MTAAIGTLVLAYTRHRKAQSGPCAKPPNPALAEPDSNVLRQDLNIGQLRQVDRQRDFLPLVEHPLPRSGGGGDRHSSTMRREGAHKTESSKVSMRRNNR